MSDVSGKLSHHDEYDSDAAFLAAYKVKDYPRPSITVDLVIFSVLDAELHVLLIERKGRPYKGFWAIPGGFVDVGDAVQHQGEDIEDAAHRELEEETHLPKGSCYLEQLYTFGRAGRDPRTRVISVAYYALVRPTLAPLVVAGDDAAEAKWVPVSEAQSMPLAFDHNTILNTAVDRIRGKIDYAPIAFDMVPDTFTATELRLVYEAVKGRTYDPKNFYRRFRRMVADGVIVSTTGRRPSGGKHSAVYRFNR